MRWFTDLGNRSSLNFEHPEHKLEAKDINLEIIKVCIADRYKHECMSYDTLFGGAARRNAFLAPKGRATCNNKHEWLKSLKNQIFWNII